MVINTQILHCHGWFSPLWAWLQRDELQCSMHIALMIIYSICYSRTTFCMMTSTHSPYWSRNRGQREEQLAYYILCLDPNLVDCDAVHCTGHWTLSSRSPQNHDTCISGHEFHDIHFLVAQTSQCQLACLNVLKTGPESYSGGGRIELMVQKNLSWPLDKEQVLEMQTQETIFWVIVIFIVGNQDQNVNLGHKANVPMFGANGADEALWAFTAGEAGFCHLQNLVKTHCSMFKFSLTFHKQQNSNFQ